VKVGYKHDNDNCNNDNNNNEVDAMEGMEGNEWTIPQLLALHKQFNRLYLNTLTEGQ
jgi:hypothetical protein